MTDVTVHVRQIDGKWVAATRVSPYFCVVADSEDDVKIAALRALRYYERAKAKLGHAIQINLRWRI